jgi:hypothetical protein
MHAMILGMSLETFTLLHVVISLIAIATGIVVMAGFLMNRSFDRTTAVFLIMTGLTDLTGFLFPFKQVTPAIILGCISSVVLLIAIVLRYPMHMSWRKTYVVAACASLYFNVFVLVVQSFMKIPGLHALAPTQNEPPFAIAQLTVLVIFIVLTVFGARKFHAPSATGRSAAAH